MVFPCITITCAYNVAVCFGPRRILNVGHGGVKYIVVVKGGPYYQRSVEEGTLTRQDPVLSPKTLYRTAAPPSGYETENSTHYLKMASSELSSFIAISLIIKTTDRCHLTVK